MLTVEAAKNPPINTQARCNVGKAGIVAASAIETFTIRLLSSASEIRASSRLCSRANNCLRPFHVAGQIVLLRALRVERCAVRS